MTTTTDKRFNYFRNEFVEKLAEIYQDFLIKRNRILTKGRISPGASGDEIRIAEAQRDQELKDAKTEALNQLNHLRELFDERRRNTDRALGIELGDRQPSADVQENLLNEMREGRAWDRIKPILDNRDEMRLGEQVSDLSREFATVNDLDSIAVLRREYPFYIRARFPASDVAFHLDSALDTIEAALAEIQPTMKEAAERKKELRDYSRRAFDSIAQIQQAIEGNAVEVLIWKWGTDEAVTVNQNGIEELTSKDTKI